MLKSKKIVSGVLAAIMLAAMSTSVFAYGITPYASDTTSNLETATNSHTRWVGPSKTCTASGYISEKAPSTGAYYSVQHSTQGEMIRKKLIAGDSIDKSLTANTSTGNWRGIVQWGTITIEA